MGKGGHRDLNVSGGNRGGESLPREVQDNNVDKALREEDAHDTEDVYDTEDASDVSNGPTDSGPQLDSESFQSNRDEQNVEGLLEANHQENVIGSEGIEEAKRQFLMEHGGKKNVVSKPDVSHYIKDFIRTHVYPKMKFFRRSDMVASRSKVAQLVLDEVSGIDKEKIQERDEWWNKHVRIVRTTIDDRRAANSNAIKDVFLGK